MTGKEKSGRLRLAVLFAALLAAAVVYKGLAAADSVIVEAGEPVPDAESFRAWSSALFPINYAETPQVDTAVPGDYSVLLTCMGTTFTRTVCVRDTVAPTAVARNLTLTIARELTPEEGPE